MEESQKENQVENGGIQQPTTKPEFTNLDAENLYASCLDVQRLDWTLQQEIQLSKLITKLRKWTTPITESRQKFSKSLGFIQQGNTYIPLSTIDTEDKENNIIKLNEQFEEVNKAPFDHWNELKGIIPLPLFTQKKLEEDKIKFTNCSQKQYFLEFCISNG